MINIINKEDCVGCNACVQKCPKQCIAMLEDDQGFLYPNINLKLCIDCHLCEKVCPVINQAQSRIPIQTYASKNQDIEVQKSSSSGGIFFALTEYIILEKKGIVFGARFNENWEVIHDYAETIEKAKTFKGSKYVQSCIGDCFKKAEDFLKSGRTVLFSGTPCQISGLKQYLKKEYANQLLCIDFVCHGVPSPMIWRNYMDSLLISSSTKEIRNNGLQSLITKKSDIIDISFRDKRISWESYGLAIKKSNNNVHELLFEPYTKNVYMQGFLKDLYLRPSCYDCPAKCGKSYSDITIGDYWGIGSIHPEIYDNLGISLLLVYTPLGHSIIKKIKVRLHPSYYESAIAANPSIVHSAKHTKWVNIFWEKYPLEGISAIPYIVEKIRPGIRERIFKAIGGACRKILGPNSVKKLKKAIRYNHQY